MSKAVRAPIALAKSARWVRLVVPTSTSFAPARAITSGMRNAPPISTSSPRETNTSRWRASVFNTNSTAAALLLTTVAASAPVRRQIHSSTWTSRSPRRPLAKSNSRLLAPEATAVMASIASRGSGARPRLVCSTVPVRFNTRCKDGSSKALRRRKAVAISAAWDVLSRAASPSRRRLARAASTVSRTTLVTNSRPYWSNADCRAASRSSSSIDGTPRSRALRSALIGREIPACASRRRRASLPWNPPTD